MHYLFAEAAARTMDHATVLIFLLELALLLGVARLLGEMFRKIGQPAVIGELLAGLLLGPSALGVVAPNLQKMLFPPDAFQQGLLSAVSLLGVFSLLVVTGFEIDLKLISSKRNMAITISLGGIIVPFICGSSLGWVLPESCLAHPDQRLVFSLFIAVAMSISAIPVIAKVLMDLKLMRRNIGQVTMAAAMLDDSVGWIILSVLGGLAAEGNVDWVETLKSTVAAILVMGLGLTLGRELMSRLLAKIDNHFPGAGSQLSVILVLALAAGALTHYLRLEAVLGAFIIGILAGQAPRLRRDTAHTLEMLAASFLAPIFFASAGLKVNLIALLKPELMLIFAIVFVVASFGKYFGCYVAGWMCRLSHWERLALGSGMNPRGAMGIIVATLGLSAGVLNQDMYSILVGMAIVTSLLAPPLLRYCLGKLEMGAEEAARLELEERDAASFIYALRRILIPSRGGENAQLATQLLGYLDHHHHIQVTALVAVRPGIPDKEDTEAKVAEQLEQQTLSSSRVKVVAGQRPFDVILKEAEKGYDLVVLGAHGTPTQSKSERKSLTEVLFNPLIDALLKSCPCPIMIVRAHAELYAEALDVQRILVPCVGTQGSKHATELAATWAVRCKAPVTILRVVEPPAPEGVLAGHHSHQRDYAFSEQLADRHAEIAHHIGCVAETLLVEHHSAEEAILNVARSGEYSLIVLSCNRQPLSGQAFLGHRVESVLHRAPCAVAVISTL